MLWINFTGVRGPLACKSFSPEGAETVKFQDGKSIMDNSVRLVPERESMGNKYIIAQTLCLIFPLVFNDGGRRRNIYFMFYS